MHSILMLIGSHYGSSGVLKAFNSSKTLAMKPIRFCRPCLATQRKCSTSSSLCDNYESRSHSAMTRLPYSCFIILNALLLVLEQFYNTSNIETACRDTRCLERQDMSRVKGTDEQKRTRAY